MLGHERFRRWLLARRPDESVGVRQQSRECPLATFLRSSGYYWVQVGWGTCYFATQPAGPTKVRSLPAWARRFVEAVDRGAGSPPPDVTAGEALRILDEITARRRGGR